MLEIEEHLLAAYLKFYQNCDQILRSKDLLVDSFTERWCLGVNNLEKKIFFCKISLTPKGIIQKLTFSRDLRQQYEKAEGYAKEVFSQFEFHFIFWVENIPSGMLLRQLLMLEEDLDSFEVIMNREYQVWMAKISKYFYDTAADEPNSQRIRELYREHKKQQLFGDRGEISPREAA